MMVPSLLFARCYISKNLFTSPPTYVIISSINIWQTCETCPFPKIPREEASEAASATIGKKWIPLASLHL